MKDLPERKITKIAREAEKLVIHTMKESGIGSGEFDLIHYIRHHPGASQKDIASELNMDKGAVARRTKNLESKGYLYRKKNPKDGRSSLLYASEKAESLKLSKTGVESEFYSYLTADLTEEEKTSFLNTLDVLYRRSKKESRSGFPHVKAQLAGSGKTSWQNQMRQDQMQRGQMQQDQIQQDTASLSEDTTCNTTRTSASGSPERSRL